jgi:hypothetical protein
MRAHLAFEPKNGVVHNLLTLFSTTCARSWKIVGFLDARASRL